MACGSRCCAPNTDPCPDTMTNTAETVDNTGLKYDIEEHGCCENEGNCCGSTPHRPSKDTYGLSVQRKTGECEEQSEGETDDKECGKGCCSSSSIFDAASPISIQKPTEIIDSCGAKNGRACCGGQQQTELKDDRPRKSEESCCNDGCYDEQNEKSQEKELTKKNEDKPCNDDCCGESKAKSVCRDGCCVPDEESDCEDDCCGGTGKTDSCENPQSKPDAKIACCTPGASDCCTPKPVLVTTSCIPNKRSPLIDTVEVLSSASTTTDLEKGTSEREHIILSISGMTCTGCETKLKRTLSTLPYLTNLKTSLVLSRAEFDIKGGSSNAEDVIKHLHRTTEFKCERVSNRGASLDVICSGDLNALIKSDWPYGVLEVSRVDKSVLRIDFDAKVIGARDLLDLPWSRSLQLAPPRPDAGLAAGSKHVWHMGVMAILSAVLTIPVLVMAWAPLPEHETAYSSASLALATLVQVVIAGPFYPKALKALIFSRVIEMDLLIVLSTSAAYIFSVVSYGYLMAGKPLATGQFFETSTLLVTLIMVGRLAAAAARQKAAEAISIRSLQASAAVLVKDNEEDKEVDARLLQYGDTFRVPPDSRVPTDGTVISGISEVDESMLTGESLPVEKHPGSTVIAGSINGMGTLVVRLTRLPGDNTITTIACMVDEAKLSKPKIQDIADKVAGYFVPVVVSLTVVVFVIWIAVGVAVRHQSGSRATIEAITYAITVLIVSCPCAIGLAVPMVIVVASGVAAQKGVVFKTAESIEVAYKTTDVVFDKTGTLTMGKLSVTKETYLCEDKEMAKSLLLGLVSGIKHPVSLAVAAHLETSGTSSTAVREQKALVGKGVEAKYGNKVIRAGNSRWLEVASHPSVAAMLSVGLTAFCFTINDELTAVLGLEDTLRSDAIATVSHLQTQGVKVHLISGDDEGAVRNTAAQLSVPVHTVRARCSPAEKQAYIKDLVKPDSRYKKGKKPIVMFVGDGTNDAAALAQATVGVHMSSGTDIAQSAADIVLVRPNLAGALTIINVSRKAMGRVAFNFGWSFVYNLFAVLLGAGAFVHARIPPEYAGLGELVSVLPVILAAVLLRYEKI